MRVTGLTSDAILKLTGNSELAEVTYRDFVNAIVSSSDELGKVNGEVLLGLGINIGKMHGSMKESLEKTARE
jgi:hypothetical protein